MNDPQDPPRLIDTDEGSDRLRDLIRECRNDAATSEEVKRLESKLMPLIWLPPTAAGPTASATSGSGAASTTAATTSGVALKTGAAIAIAAAVAGGGLWLSRSATEPAIERKSTPAQEQPKVAEQAPAVEAPSSPAAPSEVDDQTPPTNAPTTNSPARSNVVGRERSEAIEAVSESDLLGRAQAALRADPNRALALAAEHRRKFPNGVLVQEREVLTIEALERLGRHKEAVARADGFLRSFPGSAHRSKVNAVIGR
jgi:hypothetical protein